MSPPSGPGRELAVLLSVAARIEPELMRAVRLRAARDLDVSAETDLWFGDLVEHRGFGFVVLDTALLDELRTELAARLSRAAEDDPIRLLWPTFQEIRAGQSPALIAQETATWQAVGGGREADRRIEESLQPALRALVEEEDREGIARWFLGAWDSLPERVQRSTTAWQLLTLSAVRLAEPAPSAPRPQRLSLSDVSVIAESLPQVPLYLRWSEPRLMVSDGDLGPDTFAITVPDTDPRVVELVTATSIRTILVARDTAVEEWVGPESGWLNTADGAMYLLPAPVPGALPAVGADPGRPEGADGPDADPGTDPAGQPAPDGAADPGGEPERALAADHISICYAGESRSWALWTARQLERAGRTTTLLHWDTATRTPTASLAALLAAPGQVLLLLNERALRPDLHPAQAWAEAFRAVAGPHRDRFSALVLTADHLPEGTALLRPVDVAGLDEETARRRVLERLGVPPGAPPDPPEGPRFPNEPPQVREAPRRNGYFTGRKDALEEISELLAETGPGGSRLVLHGVQGVGKSQLANEFAHRYGDGYDVVWWIQATERATAREVLASLAVHLELAAGRDPGDRIRAVHAALRDRTGPRQRWLLVFDGADDVGEIRDLLPDGLGDVLITSLTRDWAGLPGFQEYTVRPFTRNESVAFIRRRVPRATAQEAGQLAEDTEGLPLVLAQTTAWLIANAHEPVAEYLDALHGQSPSDLAVVEDDYPLGFVVSWAHALNALRERNPETVELIELMAMFSPDAIPVHLLLSAPTSFFPPGSLAGMMSDSDRWQGALGGLADLTAIDLTYSQDPSLEHREESARMHRLYHRFIRGNLDPAKGAALSATACGILAAANPRRPADPREWPAYARIIPHLGAAGVLERDEPDVRTLLLDCVENLVVRGEYDTGLRLCQQAVTRWRVRLSLDDRDMLVLEHQYANLLRRMGRYRDAEAVGTQTVTALASSRASDDLELLRAKDGLGGTLMALGRFEQARDLFEEVWRGYAARSGERERRALQARSNLALSLGLLGRFHASLDLHRELYELRERTLGAEHISTLYAGLQVAWTTRLLGRYREALALQERNARLHSRVLGPHHPQTVRAEHNLALCLRRDGLVDEARSLLTSVLRRSEQSQGELHPATLMIAADRATLLRAEQPREAHDLARAVHDHYLRLLGPDHPYTAGSLSNLALAQHADGDDRAEAEPSAEAAWRLMTRAVGEDHPWALGCRLNLSTLLAVTGRAEAALAHDAETAGRAARTVGPRHPLTLAADTARAHDLRALGRAEESTALARDTVTALRDSLGPHHPHTRSAEELRRPHWDFEPQPV